MRHYTFRVFKLITPAKPDDLDHVELGEYTSETAPWVPREGEFFRFRDSHPKGKPYNYDETAGYVRHVVTCFYGTRTTIEIYIAPRTGDLP